MKNKQIAAWLYEISELLSLDGDTNRFRVAAYERASQVIDSLPEPVEDALLAKPPKKIPGIGASIEEKIGEYLSTGRVAYLDELRGKFPPGLTEIMSITGMGPKKAKVIFDRLQVKDVAGLFAAAKAGRIRGLPGFGARTEENIIKGIAFRERAKGRIPLFEAMLLSDEMIRALMKDTRVIRVDPAGSLRRRKETIGDIDLLCAVDKKDIAAVIKHFTGLPQIERVLACGDTKVSVITGSTIQIDLRVIEPAVYGAALQYFTGSKEHNVALRTYARQKGMTISEYGVFRMARKTVTLAAKTEEDVYAALKMPYIPPEIRENRGEIEAALEGALPALVEQKDIRGDTHIHSRYSDGVNTIAELGGKARSLGYEWIVSCDHSRSLKVAHGLSIGDLRKKIREIRRFNAKSDGVTILCGVELDILPDGSLDYPDEVLKELDFVIASVHGAFKQPERQMTERIIRAIEHPYVNCIGHPTGRLIGKRPAYALDIDRVLAAARDNGKLLEINASPDRLDLYDYYCRRAKDMGIMLAIGTDAHALDHFDYMRLGVAVARRGWLEKGNLLNHFTLRQLTDYLAAVRHRVPARA